MQYLICLIVFFLFAALPTFGLKLLFIFLWRDNDFLSLSDGFTPEARHTAATFLGCFIGYCIGRDELASILAPKPSSTR